MKIKVKSELSALGLPPSLCFVILISMWTSCTLTSDFFSVLSCCRGRHAFSCIVSSRAQPIAHVTFWNLNSVYTPALSNEITTRLASFLTVTTADALFAHYNQALSASLDYFTTIKTCYVFFTSLAPWYTKHLNENLFKKLVLLSIHL